MTMIRTSDLGVDFGSVRALVDVDLTVAAGEVRALLGPNGAGKTTLVRVISTLLSPTSGSAAVGGADVTTDPTAVRRTIGLTGQYAAVDDLLTGRENLQIVGRLYQLSKSEARRRAEEALERLSLTDAADRLVRTYSGGMRRRLDLGASLVGRPKVLVLDEPTTGLDPRGRIELWDFLRELVHSGATVLLTTQYLEEADELADRITVLDHGRVIAEGTSAELKERVGGDVLVATASTPEHLAALAPILDGLSEAEVHIDERRRTASIPVTDRVRALIEAASRFESAGIAPADMAVHRPSLDDVFLALTGTGVDDPSQTGDRSRTRRKRT
jgi:ABC-2 type transport system ATP-binding protein